MIKTNRQDIQGDGNQQAGRDIVNKTYYGEVRPRIQFFERDIKNVIVYFSDNLESIDGILDDLDKIPLEEKNELNSLSDDYFEIIKEDYMEYFGKIDSFLKDPKNSEYLQMYQNTVVELRRKITIKRKDYEYFEEIFEDLYDHILDKNVDELHTNKEIIWVFLHYMYCNCDIGKKSKRDEKSA